MEDNLFFKILDNEYLLNDFEFDIRETLTFAGEEKFGRLNKISKKKLDKRCDYFGNIKTCSSEEYYKYPDPNTYLHVPYFDYCIKFSKDTPGKFFIKNTTKVSNLYIKQESMSPDLSSYTVYRKKKNNAEFGPKHIYLLVGTNSTKDLGDTLEPKLFALEYLDLKQLIKYKQIFWHSVMKETGFDLLAFPLYSDYLKLLGKDKSSDLNLTKKLIDKSFEYSDHWDAYSFGSYSHFAYYEDESYEYFKNFINLAKNLDKEVLMALYFFKVIEFLPFELAISTTNKIFNHNDGSLYSYNPLLDKESSVRNFNKIKNKFFQIELDDSIKNGNFINKNIYKIEFKKNKISELNTTLFLLQIIYKGYVGEVEKFADNYKVPYDFSLQKLYRLTEIL